MTEPELITIIEGPTPDFKASPFSWPASIHEGPVGMQVALCELRTNTGEDIITRCTHAWREGRPVRLDFPDEMRMRQQVDVVAMRLRNVDHDTILMLWIKDELDREMIEALEDDEEDDDLDDDGMDDLLGF